MANNMLREIPRGVEVLVKKAAVDPAFKKTLLAKRGRAANDIALKLEPAEAAILDAVPEEQLRVIIANTKVNPRLRPTFLGYAAGAMLAALGAAAATSGCKSEDKSRTLGLGMKVIYRKVEAPANPAEIPTGKIPADAGVITGVVISWSKHPRKDVTVRIRGTDLYAIPGKHGEFVFNNVEPGTYEIIVYEPFADKTLATSGDIQVRPGERTAVTIEIQPPIPLSVGIQPDNPTEGTGE